MSPISLGLVNADDNPFNLVSTRPLGIARVFIDPSNVLPNLWFNAGQDEIVDGVKSVGEYQLGPRQDSQLVAGRIKIVAAS